MATKTQDVLSDIIAVGVSLLAGAYGAHKGIEEMRAAGMTDEEIELVQSRGGGALRGLGKGIGYGLGGALLGGMTTQLAGQTLGSYRGYKGERERAHEAIDKRAEHKLNKEKMFHKRLQEDKTASVNHGSDVDQWITVLHSDEGTLEKTAGVKDKAKKLWKGTQGAFGSAWDTARTASGNFVHSEPARALATPIVAGLAAGTVAYGVPAIANKMEESHIARNRDKYIKAMKDVHPEMKDIPQKDLHVAYNSLAIHTPHVLRDPLLGGQTLQQMAKYRQADLNQLGEMNKLRGNTLMDQAFLNATNFAAGGVTEGFKGYQAQRIADQEHEYRRGLDEARTRMDGLRQKATTRAQTYKELRDQDILDPRYTAEQVKVDARDRQQEDMFEHRKRRDEVADTKADTDLAHRQGRDAISDAQWELQQLTRYEESQLSQADRNRAHELQLALAGTKGGFTKAMDPMNLNIPHIDPHTGEQLYQQTGVTAAGLFDDKYTNLGNLLGGSKATQTSGSATALKPSVSNSALKTRLQKALSAKPSNPLKYGKPTVKNTPNKQKKKRKKRP
jgi:hypothetical protein